MAQHDFQTINPATYSGSDLAADLNSWVAAVISQHSGTSRPSYITAGMPWYDSANSQLKMYTGSTDNIIAQGNITTFGIQIIEAADADAVRTLLGVDIIDKSLYPTIANDVTDSDHDIVFGTGKIPDSLGAEIINLTSSLTKQIDAAWAAGSAAGGLFSGTVAADTDYACFLIVKDSDGSIDAGFDTSPTAANIPSGYTAYRRVGWVVTDASSNIIGFTQDGDYFRLKSQILEVNDTTPGTSANTLTTSGPQDVQGVFGGYLDHTTSVIVLISATTDDDNVPGADDNTLRVIGTDGLQQSEITVPIDSSRQIRYRSDVGTITSLRIFLRGWIDQRL